MATVESMAFLIFPNKRVVKCLKIINKILYKVIYDVITELEILNAFKVGKYEAN